MGSNVSKTKDIKDIPEIPEVPDPIVMNNGVRRRYKI